MSVTYEVFFVEELLLRAVYGCKDEQLIQAVEATRYFQFLADLGAQDLARNLEYAKKVAPREYEPLKLVSLDPGRALQDIVMGRELRPMGVDFYDKILWCVCQAIGTRVDVNDPGDIWEIDNELGDSAVAAEDFKVHPYLPVPVVRRATVADFVVFSPEACTNLLGAIRRRRAKLRKVVEDVDEWIDALERRDAATSMLVFGA